MNKVITFKEFLNESSHDVSYLKNSEYGNYQDYILTPNGDFDDEDFDSDLYQDEIKRLNSWDGKEYNDNGFKPFIEDQLKKNLTKIEGQYIDFYGKENVLKMHISDIIETEGNIFDNSKIEFMYNMIRVMNDVINEKVEMKCSHGSIIEVDYALIAENQISYFNDRFSTDYQYNTPFSLGNDVLDEYIGNENYLEDNYSFDDDEVLSKINNVKSNEHLSNLTNLTNLLSDDTLSENDKEILAEVIELEDEIHSIVNNEEGDIGNIKVVLREGNHRFKVCELLGERFFPVEIFSHNSDNSNDQELIKKYKEKFLY